MTLLNSFFSLCSYKWNEMQTRRLKWIHRVKWRYSTRFFMINFLRRYYFVWTFAVTSRNSRFLSYANPAFSIPTKYQQTFNLPHHFRFLITSLARSTKTLTMAQLLSWTRFCLKLFFLMSFTSKNSRISLLEVNLSGGNVIKCMRPGCYRNCYIRADP